MFKLRASGLMLIATLAAWPLGVRSQQDDSAPASDAAIASVPAETMQGSWTPEAQKAKTLETYGRLVLDGAAAYDRALLSLFPSLEERAALEAGAVAQSAGAPAVSPADPGALLQVGVNVAIGLGVRLADLDLGALSDAPQVFTHGVVRRTHDGRLAWTLAMESAGARGLRLHLKDVNLPKGAECFLYTTDKDRGEAYGPYAGLGPTGTGDFWTNTVSGSTAFLELQVPLETAREDPSRLSFTVAEAAHMGGPYFFADPASGPQGVPFNEGCLTDVNCPAATGDFPNLPLAQDAVALMIFPVGQNQFICTGSLVNDKVVCSFVPYFLTANHCIGDQTSAGGLECIFRFRTDVCNGTAPDPTTLPRTLGAVLLAARSRILGNDFSFLLLGEDPPGGSLFLGWTTLGVPVGSPLFRVSHPMGRPQHYSRHSRSLTRFNCSGGGIFPGQYLQSRQVIGATEGGSSGSAVMNANLQILGQLFGVCGSDFNNTCDDLRYDTLDGKFSLTFPAIARFINNTGPDVVVAAIALNPLFPLPGQTVNARVVLRNIGRHPIFNFDFNAAFWGNLPSPPACFLDDPFPDSISPTFTLSLPGQNFVWNTSFVAPLVPGPYKVWALADYFCELCESNPNNHARMLGYAVRRVPYNLGDPAIILTWTHTRLGEGPDIDLFVTDPLGQTLSSSRDGFALGPTPEGGIIDMDDQGATGPGDGNGPERAIWPPGRGPSGMYTIGVRYWDAIEAPDGSVPRANYTVRAFINGVLVLTRTGVLTDINQETIVGDFNL